MSEKLPEINLKMNKENAESCKDKLYIAFRSLSDLTIEWISEENYKKSVKFYKQRDKLKKDIWEMMEQIEKQILKN